MRKSLRIFRRDVVRIARARRTWIIVLGVLITPALYAWFNISAFWDPYANTGNIRVAVVDLDEGASSDLTGPVDIGAQVVDQLRADHQLGWQFMDEADAMRGVRNGDVYAAIVIPADFSTDLLSITTDSFTQPALKYYVNEKTSAIAPKITDVGASGIDSKISSAFIEKVADAATEAMKNAGDSVKLKLLNARQDSLNAFDDTSSEVASARQGIADAVEGIERAGDSLGDAKGTLADVGTTLGDVQTALGQAQSIIAAAQSDVLSFTDAATTAYVQGATLLADASTQAYGSVTRITQALGEVGTRIDTATSDVTSVIDANAAALAQLQAMLDEGQLPPGVAEQVQQIIDALQQQNSSDKQLLEDLRTLNATAGQSIEAVQAASDALTQATQGSQASAAGLRTALTQSIPALNSAMSALASSAGGFSAALDAQRMQLGQASSLLDGLDTQLTATSTALGVLDGNLAGVQQNLAGARTDVMALGSASSWQALNTVTGLDPQQIAQFVASPVDVVEEAVFPVGSYGSAMAALFTNLSLWIGAFVLMVIFKVEVDTEGVAPVTVHEAYVGRFLLFGAMAVGQALVVTIGNLVLGVQTVNAPAFVGTAVLTSLAYVSIIYSLCVSFGHLGRGLCVLLVIMQIPGASGLYPIELMPAFFRGIYPFLPFTYGIDAMRETIAGFYGWHWLRFMAVLGLFVLLAWTLGLLLRRRLANLNQLVNRQLRSTDLLVAEDVQVTGGGYRLTDIIHALSDREQFQESLERRARSFKEHYSSRVKLTLLVGLAGMVVLGLLSWLLHDHSATLLFLWVLWCLIVAGFLVVLEYVRNSFTVAGELAGLDDESLQLAMRDNHTVAETTGDAYHPLAGGDAGSRSSEPDGTAHGAPQDVDDDALSRLFESDDEFVPGEGVHDEGVHDEGEPDENVPDEDVSDDGSPQATAELGSGAASDAAASRPRPEASTTPDEGEDRE